MRQEPVVLSHASRADQCVRTTYQRRGHLRGLEARDTETRGLDTRRAGKDSFHSVPRHEGGYALFRGLIVRLHERLERGPDIVRDDGFASRVGMLSVRLHEIGMEDDMLQ